MANFTFLNNVGPGFDDDEQEGLEAHQNAKANEEYGAASRKSRMDKHPTLLVTDPKAPDEKGDFMKKRGQAADFAKGAALKGLDQLALMQKEDARRQEESGLPPVAPAVSFDYEAAKNKILLSPPEGYAQALLDIAKQHVDESDLDGIMRPAEEAVTQYKRMQLENASKAGAIQGQLAEQDAPMIQAHIQSLDQKMKETEQEAALAATSRQKQTLNDNLRWYASQKQQLVAKLPPEQPMEGERKLDDEVTINHVATAAGTNRQEYLQASTEIMRFLQTHGIKMTDAVSPATFGVIYGNIIGDVFKPSIRDKMFADIKGPQKPEPEKDDLAEENAKTAGETIKKGLPNVNQQIAQREQRHERIWRELAESKTFSSVLDVVGFVVASVLLGPRTAAYLFSNMHKNGNLRRELDNLNHETTQLYHEQNSYIQLSQSARNHAVERSYQRDHLKETQRHNEAMEESQYGKYRSLKGKFGDPEINSAYEQLLIGSRTWEAERKRYAEKAKDPYFAKMSGTEKAKITAGLQRAEKMVSESEAGIRKFIKDNGGKLKLQPGTPVREGTFEGSE